MLDDLSALGGLQMGATGLLAVVVVLILTGRLVPRSALLAEREDKNAWRKQAQDAIAELGVATRALEKQADSKELSVALLQSVRRGTTHQEDLT